jgi:hypothetical protein
MMSGFLDHVRREVFAQQGSSQVSDPLGLERQYQFRYRARRTLYDCFAANYGTLASGGAAPGAPRQEVGTAARGARIETASNPPARPPAGVTITVVSDTGGVWERAEAHVRGACLRLVEGVVKQAMEGGIPPQPARYDNSIPPTGAGGRAQGLTPVGMPGGR